MTYRKKNNENVVSLKKLINPHFFRVWNTDRPEVVLKGGRNSFKSSVVSIKLVTDLITLASQGQTVNVVCFRENANNLRDTIFRQILWAINKLGLGEYFRHRYSPLRIEHIASGSCFVFYGVDDPDKVKSNAIENVIALWYEEAANVKGREVFDNINPTFVRQKAGCVDNVKIFYTYNPPKSEYNWINEWVKQKEKDPDCLVDSSTYLDDELGLVSDQMLRSIETFKKNDYDYYRWLYLGEVVGLGTSIYNMNLFHEISTIDELPDDDHIVMIKFSADTGHSVSATTVSCYGITYKRRVVILDTYYYSPHGKANKKSPSQLAPEIHAFIERLTKQYPFSVQGLIMDSAEQALRNEYHSRYGVDWINVRKLKTVDMVDRVQSILAANKVYYLPTENNLKYFLPEHAKYQWDSKTIQRDNPEVIKVDDHTVDGFKYLVRESENELGIGWI